MIEAALFYEGEAAGLGDDFLDDVQHAIDSVREHPELSLRVAHGFRRVLVRRFPFSIIYTDESAHIMSLLSPTSGALRTTGKDARDC